MSEVMLVVALIAGLALVLRVEPARLARLRSGHRFALDDLRAAVGRRGFALEALLQELPAVLPGANAPLDALGRAQRSTLDALLALVDDPTNEPAASIMIDAGRAWDSALDELEGDGAGELLTPLLTASDRVTARLRLAVESAHHHDERRTGRSLRSFTRPALALSGVTP